MDLGYLRCDCCYDVVSYVLGEMGRYFGGDQFSSVVAVMFLQEECYCPDCTDNWEAYVSHLGDMEQSGD